MYIPSYIILFFILLMPSALWALDLKGALNKSLNIEGQKQTVQANYQIRRFQNFPIISPWRSSVDASFDRRWRVLDGSGSELRFNTYNLTSRVVQSTPYGFNFNLDYEQGFNLPQVPGFFATKERINANVAFSLWNDIFGQTTREAQKFHTQEVGQIYLKRATAEQCREVSLRYFDAYRNQNRLDLVENALKDLQKIHRQLSPNLNRGAVRKQDQLSLQIDLVKLKADQISARSDYEKALVELSRVSQVELQELKGLSLSHNVDLGVLLESKYQILEEIDLDIKLLEAKKTRLRLDQGQDVRLYMGFQRAELFPFNTDESMVMGLNVNWVFGNENLKGSEKNLELEIAKKSIEKDVLLARIQDVTSVYSRSLQDKKQIADELYKSFSYSSELQSIAAKNLTSGRISFFEYLSLRNQANDVKNQYFSSLVGLYSEFIDYAFLKGDYDSVCLM